MSFPYLPNEVLHCIAAAIPPDDPTILALSLCCKRTLAVVNPLLKIWRWRHICINDAFIVESDIEKYRDISDNSFRHPLQAIHKVGQDPDLAKYVSTVTMASPCNDDARAEDPKLLEQWAMLKEEIFVETPKYLSRLPLKKEERDNWRSQILAADVDHGDSRNRCFALLLSLLPNLSTVKFCDQRNTYATETMAMNCAAAIYLYIAAKSNLDFAHDLRYADDERPVLQSSISIKIEFANAYSIDPISRFMLLPLLRTITFHGVRDSPPNLPRNAVYPLTMDMEFGNPGHMTVRFINCEPPFIKYFIRSHPGMLAIEIFYDQHYLNHHQGVLTDAQCLLPLSVPEVTTTLEECLSSLQKTFDGYHFEPLPEKPRIVTSTSSENVYSVGFYADRRQRPPNRDRDCIIM